MLRDAATGDRDAFAEVYTHFAPLVHGLVLRILRDPHQAEEVTQEVFVQAWLGAAGFDADRGSARAWLMTLAHRRTVDRVRSAEAARRRDHGYAEDPCRARQPATESLVEASLDADRLHSAMTVLSPAQREALELSYFGGHTYVEVATLLGIPVGTAKSRIRDALRRLRDVLVPALPQPA